MKKVIRLTESDLAHIVKRVIEEQLIDNALSNAGKGAAYGSVVPGLGTWVGGIGGFVVGLIDGAGVASEKVKKIINTCSKGNYPINGRTNQIADNIYDGVNYSTLGVLAGTDEEKVYKAMSMPRTIDEFCGVVKSYKSSYGEDLFSALEGDFSSEDEWVKIMRPLRNVALKSKQMEKTKMSQPKTKPPGQPKTISVRS